MIENVDLPHVLAVINMAAILLLASGYRLILPNNRETKKICAYGGSAWCRLPGDL